MQVTGTGLETYLLVIGLKIERAISLGDGITLLPVHALPPRDVVLASVKNPVNRALVSLSFPLVHSQLLVTGKDSEDVAVRAWNASWDVILLAALYNTPVSSSLQSTTSLNAFDSNSEVLVTDRSLHGFKEFERVIEERDAVWLEANFPKARTQLSDHRFQTAVHCLASFHWHSLPRAQLALIWAGIESLFGVDSEIVFRVSLYVAKFLAPGDRDAQFTFFEKTKRLYKARSQAVHGAKMKGEPVVSVDESAELLQALIVQCTELGSLPDVSKLAL